MICWACGEATHHVGGFGSANYSPHDQEATREEWAKVLQPHLKEQPQ
jgi:hypothetical protein